MTQDEKEMLQELLAKNQELLRKLESARVMLIQARNQTAMWRARAETALADVRAGWPVFPTDTP